MRLLKLLGVRAVILTNAAGGVNLRYRPGDVMVISDHIKLNGASPLRGRNVDAFGERFFDTTRMYTPELRAGHARGHVRNDAEAQHGQAAVRGGQRLGDG